MSGEAKTERKAPLRGAAGKTDRRTLLRGGAGALAVAATPAVTAVTAATARAQFFGGGGARRDDAWLGISAAALEANLAAVKERAGGRPVMAVVKANAYGHGLTQVASILAAAGADAFMVGNVEEAVSLSEAGIEQPILNFGKIYEGSATAVLDAGIEQMIADRDTVSSLVAIAAQNRAEARVHVHIDTGLGRMGVPHEEALDLIRYVAGRSRIHLAGVSTALTEDPEYDREQLGRFQAVCDAATAEGIALGVRHVASSAALFDLPEAHLDMVRPGIALYGHYPSEAARAAYAGVLQPAAGLRVRVAAVRRLRPGDSVGYHRVHVAAEPETIAVLPIGYSDGYPPEAARGGGQVAIGGRRCAIVGEVSANHFMVRVPDGLEVSPGDFALPLANGAEPPFFGGGRGGEGGSEPAPLAHELAAWAGISVYQLHIRLGASLPRTIEGRRGRR